MRGLWYQNRLFFLFLRQGLTLEHCVTLLPPLPSTKCECMPPHLPGPVGQTQRGTLVHTEGWSVSPGLWGPGALNPPPQGG